MPSKLAPDVVVNILYLANLGKIELYHVKHQRPVLCSLISCEKCQQVFLFVYVSYMSRQLSILSEPHEIYQFMCAGKNVENDLYS